MYTVKPVQNAHSQKDQKLVFKTNYRLMQVSVHAQGKIHFRHRKFGLTWLHWPIFAFNMVKNRPTISLDVLKDINKYIFK